MRYSSINVSVFISDLRKGINERMSQFFRHVQDEFRKKPEQSRTKSKRQWMLEYKEWAIKNAVEKEISEYLTEGDKDENS